MCFVENHVLPSLASKDVLIGQYDLVRGDAHLKAVLRVPTNTAVLPFLLIAVVGENLHAREEFLELHFPVQDDRRGHDDEVLTPDAFVAGKMS